MAEAAIKEDTVMVFDKNPFYIVNGEMRWELVYYVPQRLLTFLRIVKYYRRSL